MKDHGDAYTAVRYVYDRGRKLSWSRLNGALHGALCSALEANLTFTESTFRAMHDEMAGGYWMGNGSGHVGERYYSLAVKLGHTPACISFESFAGRPAALWSETVRTPERLHIGSKFTWDGMLVTVTNMMADHLIACTYKDSERTDRGEVIRVGDKIYAGDYRTVVGVKYNADGTVTTRLKKSVSSQREQIARRFKIPYEELASRRKQYAANYKAAMALIDQATTLKELDAVKASLTASISGGSYLRHFEIEEVRKHCHDREKDFRSKLNREELAEKEAADLERWVSGERVHAFFKTVKIRIEGSRVATSTGQSVSLESAKALLPWALGRRDTSGTVNHCMLDSYQVERTGPDGVKIGCTVIPWSEVERFSKLPEVKRGLST